jgi:parallel beta-helix repeat protein
MVFVDEARLRQVGVQGNPQRAEKAGLFSFKKKYDGKDLADLVAGSFFYDTPGKRLCVWLADGGDPSKHVVEAAVRTIGVRLDGTWTLRGFDVRHIADGEWPREQAVSVSGNRSVVEDCRVTQNGFLGMIVSGEDCIIRGNVIADNGLMGFTSNCGYRMLFEGNELCRNGWRGDVLCLTQGNKWVLWRDCKWLRNWWHDEPACALWLDISDANALIVENRFDNCSCGIYFEISRWGVIANNVFRHCGRACWIYSSDVLVAHNVFDSCGEGVIITGDQRLCNDTQSGYEPITDALMAVRNNLVVDNLLIDCPGAYIGITEDTAYGAGNLSDYNVFAWTLPAYHPSGMHINFMNGWNTLYATLPIWRQARHCDTHSMVSDPGLVRELQGGSPWVGLTLDEVVGDPRIVGREKGDYHLAADSPLRNRGIAIPAVLNSGYAPGADHVIVSRAWAKTEVESAPDAQAATVVDVWAEKHYRLQPLPAFHALVDLDAQGPATPGLNDTWAKTGKYPVFDASHPADTAASTDWMVRPDNRLADPSFDKLMTRAGGAAAGPWLTNSDLNTFAGVACANLFAANRSDMSAWQKVGVIAPDCEYVVWGQIYVDARPGKFGSLARLCLAVGPDMKSVGDVALLQADAGKVRGWQTCFARYHSGKAGVDPNVGQDLYVLIGARVIGPASDKFDAPVAFARWDNLVLLSGATP